MLRRFMPAVLWQEGHCLRETGWYEANSPVGVQKPPRTTIMTSGIDLENLPDPQDELAELVLALYREALNSAGLT